MTAGAARRRADGKIEVEICLDDLAGIAIAEAEGADRIELCSDLAEGGLTPSIGTVTIALRTVHELAVHVLVRQRAGDFVYSEPEVEAMVEDIRAIRAVPNPAGVSLGFVIGALTPQAQVDLQATRRLLDACAGAPVTFHKAFDATVDRFAALEMLAELGVHRVLTSGGTSRARDGAAELAELVLRSRGRVGILAAGGVRPGNAAALVQRTGVREVHLRAPAGEASAVALPSVTSAQVVRSVVAELRQVRA